MTKLKAKFELYQRLQAMGFTYDEARALRRIEMALHRWAEAECNGDIQRDEKTDKPFRHLPGYHRGGNRGWHDPKPYPIADREAGALKRLKAIIEARNNRPCYYPHNGPAHSWTASPLWFFHQTDPRGCALYIGLREEMTDSTYTRGLAVSPQPKRSSFRIC